MFNKKTHIIKVILAVGAIFIALSTQAIASQVSHAPLENAVKETNWIIKAKILNVDHKDPLGDFQIEYELEPSTVLMGEVKPPKKMTASYQEILPVIRNEQGEIVGTVSLIYSGSGAEFTVIEYEEWIFFFGVEGVPEDGVAKVLRAEPMSKLDEVMALIP